MARILIKNATLITMDSRGSVLEKGMILVEGNRIKKIGHMDELDTMPPEFREGRCIDAGGKIIVPGLVNAHGHAAMTMFRSYADDLPLKEWLETKIWPLEEKLDGEDVYWGTLLSMVEMIRSGTTTFADMYFFMDRVADAVVESGMRGVLCRGMVGVGDNADAALKESESFYRTWHGEASGRITVTLGPHAPYTCPPQYLKKTLELAGRLGASLQIHLAETEWEIQYCRDHYGMSPVELMDSLGLFHVPTLAAHCVHLSQRDIDILAEKNVGVAHNPGSNLKLASGIAPLPQLLEAGIPVGLGTDGASSNNNLDLLEEVRLAALLHKGITGDARVIPAGKALEMATRMGGVVVFNEDIGTLEEGKRADLVVYKYKGVPHMTPGHNPVSDLVYAAQPRDVDLVMIDGEIVLENGVCTRLDEERILFEARNRASCLVQGNSTNSI